MRRRVYIAHTGGTIGMAEGERGFAPAPGHLAELMARIPDLHRPEMPEYEIGESEPLLDSADMSPDEWGAIARDIASRYDEFDGFVVLHGTDTMAYTASALAFMFENLGKPVVLTGSQIPLGRLRSDARDNLITSLILAAGSEVPEVCLFFGNRLLRGCRSVKVNASGFDAFDSPNLPPLGHAGIDLRIERRLVLPPPPPGRALGIQAFERPAVVGALRLFPGISGEVLENVLRPRLRGLVIEAYGVGNGPTREERFLDALRDATERGVVIVDCTQCLRGTVDLADYATGRALADAGVVSGRDMTAEAALAKLCYLLSRDLEPDEVRREIGRSLRGELTEA